MARSQLANQLRLAYSQGNPVQDHLASTKQSPQSTNSPTTTDPSQHSHPTAAHLFPAQRPFPWAPPSLPPARSAPVLIVGAGLAGLVVAYRLRQAGWAADIVEARDRLGGRILSASHALSTPFTAELGGEAFDSHHHHCLALAQELGLTITDLLTASTRDLEEVYFFGGQRISIKSLSEQFASIASVLQPDVDAARQFITTAIVSDRILALDRQSISEYLSTLHAPPLLQSVINQAYTIKYGADATDQSSLNFLGFIQPTRQPFYLFGHSDERYCIAGGNQQLPLRLAQAVADQITPDTRLVALSTTPSGRYRTTFEGGGHTQERTYDYVVLTIPFNLLRSISLTVPLPPRQQQAIANLGYNSPTKLITRYRYPLWRTHFQASGLVYTDLPMQHLWETSESTTGQEGPALLTNYTGGRQGEYASTLNLEKLTQETLLQGDQIFPGLQQVYQSFPSLRSNWLQDCYSQAAYSCYQPGQWTAFYGQEGRQVGNLLFAGEHCSRYHQGYMEGAAETGSQAAIALLNSLTP